MHMSVWALATSAVLVASCGGGGGSGDGDPLYVSLTYPDNEVSLYRQTRVQPDFGGFEGHAPHCSLVGNGLPAGMRMGGDCVISGRPTEDGVFFFTVSLGASGASNTLSESATLVVHGPLVQYPERDFLHKLSLGERVNDAPSFENWKAGGDLQASWSFRIASGELPPGLALDPLTGRITGKVQAKGTYTATVQSKLETQFGSYTPVVSSYPVTVTVAGISYAGGETDPGNAMDGTQTIYISQAARLQPDTAGAGVPGTTFSDFSVRGDLPPGLTLDARTGVISGVPTGPVDRVTLDVRATLRAGGASEQTQGSLEILVRSPLTYEYPVIPPLRLNTFARIVPLRTMAGTVPLSPSQTVTFGFLPDPFCPSLPPGMALDPASGTISGTPAASEMYNCRIEYTITNDGVTWRDATPVNIYVP